MQEEQWSPLWDFPGYWISDRGMVRHRDRDQSVTVSMNRTGSVYVSLWRDNRANSRSLPLLVASTFLDAPQHESFDAAINLNGVRRDCRAENLMWRPTWFARKYHQQFRNGQRGFKIPVILLDTGEIFPTSWEAAVKYGLLDSDILARTYNNEKVWPYNYSFRPVDMERLPSLRRTLYQPA